jgi:uncharacterized protein YuzE
VARVVPVAVDNETAVAYIWLHGENEAHGISRTIEATAYLDINGDGEVVGVEIIGWPKEPT